jgi:ABC-2 type transport system permease protein
MALATDTAGRTPRAWDFMRLKLRLLGNGFRGHPGRVALLVLGMGIGLLFAILALFGLSASGAASRDVGFVVAAFAGTAVVVGWTLVPLLFFGVDETLDPARFALLPIGRMTLARGMLAAAFIGVPAFVTLVATSGIAIAAGTRYGWLAAAVALLGVVAGLAVGVIASRAVTSAFAALLRSRRVRDLAAVLIALLAASVGPMQWVLGAAIERGNLTQALKVADILAWTPLGAPYVWAFDVAEGHLLAAAARLGITAATIGLRMWWWSRTIESAMLGAATSSGGRGARATSGTDANPTGAVGSLIPRPMRRVFGTGVFGAILARESRFWWREPRRRASLLSIMVASAVVPIALSFGSRRATADAATLSMSGFSFAVTLAGTMGGLLLANQFAYDGSAYAAHLLAHVPGRVELRARAAAIGLVAIPVQLAVVLVVTILTDSLAQLPAGIGLLAAGFGASLAAAALLSVLAPYALPENTNPFSMNSGGGSAKGILTVVALTVTLIISAPVLVASFLLADTTFGPSALLGIGVLYGLALAWLGTVAAGAVLDRRGPEILAAITPRR